MSRRIKLKNPSNKSRHHDRDYDPTVPEIQFEEQRDVKRKTSSIRLVNPNAKKRKIEIERIDAESVLVKAKKIEETLRDVESLDLELALLDQQITNNSPAVNFVSNKLTAKNSKRTKTYDGGDSIDDEEDEDYEAYQKEPLFTDDAEKFDDDTSLNDDEDTTFDSHDSVAATRSKRPPRPSQKYPDLLKNRNKASHRRARVQHSRTNEVTITGSKPATSVPSSTSRRLKLIKPVLEAPFWKPIKAPLNTSNPEALAQCRKLLFEIQKKQDSDVFKRPVDPVKDHVLDYFTVIKQPMDLSTVQKNLKDKKITTAQQFYQQMRLIWDNAILFNGEQHFVGQAALRLSKHLEIKMKPILAQENPQTMDASELKHKITVLTREYKALETELASLNAPLQEPERVLVNPADPSIDLSPQIGNLYNEPDLIKTIDYAEKCHLYNAISGLQPCFHRGLYQLIADSTDKQCIKYFPDHVEVDSDFASPSLLMKLQIYIRECRSVMSNDKKAPQTPGKQPTSKREESEQSSSTSESDSDSDESSEGDPRLKTGTFVGAFIEQKRSPLFQQPQQTNSIPQSPRLFSSSSPSTEESKLVVVRNSDSWSQLANTKDQDSQVTTAPSENWENLKNRKTQIEQIEKEKEEQEALRNQQMKMKAEEEARRFREEIENKRKEAELAEAKKREIELQKRAQMKANEQARRQEGLNATLLKQPVNMMQQFMIMSNFQSEISRK
jgi:hypothetical protein